MSYIAVSLKVIEGLAADVARTAAITEDRALAGLVRLWHRVWSKTSDTLTLAQLAGVMGGERITEVAASLVAHGFLEPLEGAFRVRGAERYLRVKASRAEGAKKTNEARSRAKRADALERSGANAPRRSSPSTEHRTPNTTTTKDSDPRHSPLVARLTATFADVRETKYPFTARDAKAVEGLLESAEPEAIDAAWRKSLTHRGFPTVSTLSELKTHLAHFLGTGPPVGPRGPADVPQWTNDDAGEIHP